MMEWLASLENSGFGTWLRESPRFGRIPRFSRFTPVGLGVLVGGNAVIDLRLLGWGKAMWIGLRVGECDLLGAHAPVHWQRLLGLSPWPRQHC